MECNRLIHIDNLILNISIEPFDDTLPNAVRIYGKIKTKYNCNYTITISKIVSIAEKDDFTLYDLLKKEYSDSYFDAIGYTVKIPKENLLVDFISYLVYLYKIMMRDTNNDK